MGPTRIEPGTRPGGRSTEQDAREAATNPSGASPPVHVQAGHGRPAKLPPRGHGRPASRASGRGEGGSDAQASDRHEAGADRAGRGDSDAPGNPAPRRRSAETEKGAGSPAATFGGTLAITNAGHREGSKQDATEPLGGETRGYFFFRSEGHCQHVGTFVCGRLYTANLLPQHGLRPALSHTFELVDTSGPR